MQVWREQLLHKREGRGGVDLQGGFVLGVALAQGGHQTQTALAAGIALHQPDGQFRMTAEIVDGWVV